MYLKGLAIGFKSKVLIKKYNGKKRKDEIIKKVSKSANLLLIIKNKGITKIPMKREYGER